jgi:predicted DNA-binding WGR domain protein
MPPKKAQQIKKRDAKAKDKKNTALNKTTQAIKLPVLPDPSAAKGPVQVDAFVPSSGDYSVVTDGDFGYSCYLMWSDVKNNHNKYYILQVLKSNNREAYHYWNRYGRVGYDGVKDLQMMSKDSAVRMYDKKYKEKVNKGYVEVKMALGKAD